MTAWKISQWDTGADHLVATRNPYYWKVDITGQQLPYIDEIYFYLVENTEAANALGLAGKIDAQDRHIDLAKFPLYQENAEAGNYHMLTWDQAQASQMSFFPNQSYADPKYRELMQNFNFRKALSLAIDREQINQVSYLGLATPRTVSVVNSSALYQPELENLNGEFDPDTASALLDEIGLPLGADGKRTFEDGSPIELVVETYYSGPQLDAVELAAENWRALGFNVTVKTMSRDIYWPRACANEVMISTWGTDRGLVPMIDPIYQFPFDERSWMAPAFGIWYKTAGKEGEAPSAEMKELMDLYDQYRGTVDRAEQKAIGQEIVKLTTERLNVIQTVGMAPAPVVVKNYFHNVAETHTSDWLIMTPGTQDPSHYWMEPH
jgi:peptide/nickel transport system substrate-binding protein